MDKEIEYAGYCLENLINCDKATLTHWAKEQPEKLKMLKDALNESLDLPLHLSFDHDTGECVIMHSFKDVHWVRYACLEDGSITFDCKTRKFARDLFEALTHATCGDDN
jgi:hypothetical protein